MATIIGAWLVEIARGHDGEPYCSLATVAGAAHLLAVAYLRWPG